MAKNNNEAPERITLSSKEMKELENRLRDSSLDKKDISTLLGVLAFVVWIQERLSRSKLTIKRLCNLFGFTSEAKKSKKKDGESDEDPASNDAKDDSKTNKEANATDNSATKNQVATNWEPKQNHGRLGAKDYSGCDDIEVPFTDDALKNNQCPNCKECHTDAKLTPVDPSVIVLLDARPLISGERYHLQKSRCAVCQKYFTAKLPPEVAERSKYSNSCYTTIAINHYLAGQPFKRLEMLQAAQKVPLPDSTQYDMMNTLYQGVMDPIAKALRACGANGNELYFDDTKGQVLEQIMINSHAKTRKGKKGVHTTALLSEYQGHRIYLFDTNTLTAGKQLQNLLESRTIDDKFITMSDASASNFPLLDEALMARWIICLCLSHGRRRFFELLGEQDEDLTFILDLISKVYANERHCKNANLDPNARLLYHQTHSAPIMSAMRIWFNNLLLFKKVEPNSRLGEAIIYMIKRWEWLTQFLRVAGAPLDNNICEQAIKVAIRYRKNSLFYRTFYGASIGDAMMSVLYTAKYNGINIFDYLNKLQENLNSVQENPERWLPWNYQETLALFNASPPLENIA